MQRRQSNFWLRCKSRFILGIFHETHLFVWHLFLPDLEENEVYEKLLFNLHLICVYQHIYCDSPFAEPGSVWLRWVCLLGSSSPTKAFSYNPRVFFVKKKKSKQQYEKFPPTI